MKRAICILVVALMAGSASAAFIGGPDIDTSDAVTATSPNGNGGHSAMVTVTGIGLDATGKMHDTQGWQAGSSWLGEGNNKEGINGGGGANLVNPGTYTHATDPNWLRYDFDQVYGVAQARVWNYNGEIPGRGLNQVIVEYSTTGGADPGEWTQLVGPGEDGAVTFPEASGDGDYTGFILDFGVGQVDMKSVVFTVLRNEAFVKNHSSSGNIGLSEVQFIVPEPATMGLIALGGVALLRKRR